MRPCHVLRVFTRGDTGGNHLGVVTDSSGLSDDTMQRIAAELGFSETVFVERTGTPLPRVRIFTPGAEIPFAGHPLVGAAWVLGGESGPGAAPEQAGPPDGAPVTVEARLECGVGEIPFRAVPTGAEIDVPLVGDVAAAEEGPVVAGAAGLPPPTGSWWARMPIPYLLLEVASGAAVAAADPDVGALASGPSGEATYVFARAGRMVKARFFAPVLGVAEDPATGSAAAALAAVLAHRGERSGSLIVSQGDEIGHPSTIEVAWGPGGVTLAGSVRSDGVRMLPR